MCAVSLGKHRGRDKVAPVASDRNYHSGTGILPVREENTVETAGMLATDRLEALFHYSADGGSGKMRLVAPATALRSCQIRPAPGSCLPFARHLFRIA